MGFLNALLIPLEPYLIWLKLSIAIVFLACSFWAGVRWESSAVNALLLKQERLVREAQDTAAKVAEEALAQQLIQRAQADKARLVLQKKMEVQRAEALRRAYEFWTSNAAANVVIDAGAVRVWRSTNGEPDKPAAPATAPASGAPDADTGRCTLSDLHANHEQLVSQYAALRLNMIELQQWAVSAVKLCNSK